jgi:hypothetical protein
MEQPPSMVMRAILGYFELLTAPADNEAWPCYLTVHPPASAQVKMDSMVLVDTTGVPQGRLMSGPVIERASCQLRVRSSDYRIGWKKAHDISKKLEEILRMGIDIGNYLYFIPAVSRAPILNMGQEEATTQRHYLFAVNMTFQVQEEGPYEEWGNEQDALYYQLLALHELIHVDFADYF